MNSFHHLQTYLGVVQRDFRSSIACFHAPVPGRAGLVVRLLLATPTSIVVLPSYWLQPLLLRLVVVAESFHGWQQLHQPLAAEVPATA